MKNQRQKRLLYKLLDRDNRIVIKDLAQYFSVSTRTIRRDLDDIENYLKKEEINLIRQQGKGVWLETTKPRKIDLLNKLHLTKAEENSSLRSRVINYIRLLFSKNNALKLDDLVQYFSVSMATVYNDLARVKVWLNRYQLSLVNKKNKVFIKGKERNIRMAIVDLIFELLGREQLIEIIELLNEDISINAKDHKILKDFCISIDLNIIKNFIKSIELKLGIRLSNYSILSLSIYCAVFFNRIANEKEIIFTKSELKDLNSNPLNLFEFSKEKLEELGGVRFSEGEFKFFLAQVLAAKLDDDLNLSSIEDITTKVDKKIFSATEKLIACLEEELNIFLKDNFFLIKRGVLYLRGLYLAKRYGIKYKQSFLNQEIISKLKYESPYLFEVAKISYNIIKRELNIDLSLNQIDYISLILLANIEKRSDSIKVILIRGNNYILTELMQSRLENRVARIEVIDLIEPSQLKESKEIEADLIIGPREIETVEDMMVVTPLLNANEIKTIQAKVDLLYLLHYFKHVHFNLDIKLDVLLC